MSEREDAFDSFESVLKALPLANPWELNAGDSALRYVPDRHLLERLMAVPLGEGRASASGRLAKAIDAWVAHELRRCGFPPDEVWPRAERPRVLPRELGLFLDALPRDLQAPVREQLLRNTRVAPTDARVLGRAYVKQVDVVVAQWARGPELLVSTKSMVSSFRNNLFNRFEEAYGDAKNLRGRYPLAAIGFLFVLRSTVLDERGAFEQVTDMLRKLRAEADVYDATGLVLAEWSGAPFNGVLLRDDAVPPDLSPGEFLGTLVARVLDRTPVGMHVHARELREHREIPLN